MSEQNNNEIERLGNDIQDEFIKNVKVILRHGDINFTGNLSESFEKTIENGFHAVVTSNKYAGIVDQGMRPGGKVNFDMLRFWVEEKLKVSKDESYEVTMKIFNKIRAKGITPKRFMKKSIKKLIGTHGKITPVNKRSTQKRSNFSKKLKKLNRNLKKLVKDFKSINRKIKKATNIVKKPYRKSVRKKR